MLMTDQDEDATTNENEVEETVTDIIVFLRRILAND